ncbi:hypothetical protein KC930_00190 [Candidatus Saccharibacteria bacterium]|nr:hypothetical protein [Candidatus Saccharibacteria bacterium]
MGFLIRSQNFSDWDLLETADAQTALNEARKIIENSGDEQLRNRYNMLAEDAHMPNIPKFKK